MWESDVCHFPTMHSQPSRARPGALWWREGYGRGQAIQLTRETFSSVDVCTAKVFPFFSPPLSISACGCHRCVGRLPETSKAFVSVSVLFVGSWAWCTRSPAIPCAHPRCRIYSLCRESALSTARRDENIYKRSSMCSEQRSVQCTSTCMRASNYMQRVSAARTIVC